MHQASPPVTGFFGRVAQVFATLARYAGGCTLVNHPLPEVREVGDEWRLMNPLALRPLQRRIPTAVVSSMPHMPLGTLGYRISEHLAREDYVNVLVPPLRRAVEAGDRLRVLFAIGPELHMEPGALWEDMKLEAELGIEHRNAWERIAIVTDIDWLRQGFGFFSWMIPGDVRLFAEGELDQAKTWL